MALSLDWIASAAVSRAASRLARAAQAEALAPGVSIRPDSPPGVGWVLERDGKSNRYLSTRDQAVEHWRGLDPMILSPAPKATP